MVQKLLTQKTDPTTKHSYFRDEEDDVQDTGVVVDDAAYDTGTFKDRDYDVRGYSGLSIALENLGANGFTYTILSTEKDFAEISPDTPNKLDDLVIGDFDTVEVASTAVAGGVGTKSETFELLRITPKTTAVKLRVKETVAASSTTVRVDTRGS